MGQFNLGTTIGGYPALHQGAPIISLSSNASSLAGALSVAGSLSAASLSLGNGMSLAGSISYDDTSRYWLTTATNWGLYWNTTDNRLEFHGGGTNRAWVDLDDGGANFSAGVTVGSLTSGNGINLSSGSARSITLLPSAAGVSGASLTISAGRAASGTDIAGGTLILQTGNSTGTGTARIEFRTTNVAASSGTGLNTLGVRGWVDANGLTISGAIDATSITQDAWTNVSSFSNGWINYGSPFIVARYMKDRQGMVVLSGLVKSGAVQDGPAGTIFTLPVGYRPSGICIFTVHNTGSTTRLDIYPEGNVVAVNGGNGYLSLEGVAFRI